MSEIISKYVNNSGSINKKEYELFELLDIGDFVGIKGKVFKTKTKEISIN